MKKMTKISTKRKRKKTDIEKLRKDIEDLAKLVAKHRDNWTCQHCGKYVTGIYAHGSHIIPVSHGNSLRFDPKNILCMCYHCHMNWWHKNPTEAGDWFNEKYPELKEYVDSKKNLIVKYSLEDYKRMKHELEELIERYS